MCTTFSSLGNRNRLCVTYGFRGYFSREFVIKHHNQVYKLGVYYIWSVQYIALIIYLFSVLFRSKRENLFCHPRSQMNFPVSDQLLTIKSLFSLSFQRVTRCLWRWAGICAHGVDPVAPGVTTGENAAAAAVPTAVPNNPTPAVCQCCKLQDRDSRPHQTLTECHPGTWCSARLFWERMLNNYIKERGGHKVSLEWTVSMKNCPFTKLIRWLIYCWKTGMITT